MERMAGQQRFPFALPHLKAGVWSRLILVALSFMTALLSSVARADDDELRTLPNGAGIEPDLTADSDYKLEVALASVLKAERNNLLLCYGAEKAPGNWDEVIDAGAPLIQAVEAIDRENDDPGVKSALDTLNQRKIDFAKAERDLADAVRKSQEAQNAVDVWSKLNDPASKQKELDAKNALLTATTAQTAARGQADEARRRVANAELALQKSTETAKSTRRAAARSPRDRFALLLANAENRSRSPANFREAFRNLERRNACRAYRAAVKAAFAKATANALQRMESSEASEAKTVTTERLEARIDDTIGKTTATSSAVTGESSILEKPGAPERLVATVMSGLGASSTTTGSQVLMTLNLGSLGSDDNTKPAASPWTRNLFLRVGLPLSTTEGQSQAVATKTGSPSVTPNVTRMSFVVGGSLYDESDPRLARYDDCFEFVKAYVPLSLNELESRARSAERQLYYATCMQLAANSDRLAWRVGTGVVTTGSADAQKTKPEILAAAVVYGPSDWILFNLIGQRLLEPYVVNTVGAGFSIYADAGGAKPGDQWGRVSFDALGLAEFREENVAVGVQRSRAWAANLSFSAYGKILTGGVAQFSVGPRIVSSGDVALFGTVALSYDADNLINSLLAPPAKP